MSELIEALASLPGQEVVSMAGETLFHRGDAVRFLYVVRSGCIHLTRFDPDGLAAVMQRATDGMLLAESSIFSDAYHCDAVVIADAVLQRIERVKVRQAMAANPALMEALARHLGREVQRTRTRVEVLAKRTVKERLDAWLVFNNGALPPAGSRRAIAEDIGVSPEAFYRELQRRRAALANRVKD
jgi:CRP-like cAMP-binding protein